MSSKKLIGAIVDFTGERYVLIISSNKTERSNFKKVFSQLGIDSGKIQVVDNFTDARVFLKENDVQIVFAQDFIDKGSAEDFLAYCISTEPDRSNHIFTVQASEKRHALISLYEEKYIDKIFYKPLTVNDISNSLAQLFKKKIQDQKNEFYKKYWSIQQQIAAGDFNKLNITIPNFRQANPDKAQAIYLEGLLYEKQDLNSQAIERYRGTLELDPMHVLASKSLFDIYNKKEDFINTSMIGKHIVENFTIHPNRIKCLIKSLIMTKDFKSIIDLSKKYLVEDMQDPRLENTIAASLAISGKSGYLRASMELFLEITEISLSHARGNLTIIYMCLNNLIDMGKFDLVKDYLKKLPNSETEDLIKVLKYRIDEKELSIEKVFIKGAQLANSGLHDFYIYDIWLKSALKTKKKASLVEGIIDQAVKHHPVRKNHFVKMRC